MKTILFAFTIALIPMLSIGQMPDYKNMVTAEYYPEDDTIMIIMSYKTDQHKILDGDFAASIMGKKTINGQYKNGLKAGKWLYFNDDMTEVDSADYSIIHYIPRKEYDKVYYTHEEGLQCPDFGTYFQELNVRYPILLKAKSIQGSVSFQFVLNAENEITNMEILKTYAEDMESEVIYAILNKKFPNSCTLNGKPVNYKVTGGIRFNSYDFTSEPEP